MSAWKQLFVLLQHAKWDTALLFSMIMANTKLSEKQWIVHSVVLFQVFWKYASTRYIFFEKEWELWHYGHLYVHNCRFDININLQSAHSEAERWCNKIIHSKQCCFSFLGSRSLWWSTYKLGNVGTSKKDIKWVHTF